MLTRSRLRHVVLVREKSNPQLCLSVLPQRVQFLCKEHAERTEVQTRNSLKHVVSKSKSKGTLSCVWVFFAKEFNSYVKGTLNGLKC